MNRTLLALAASSVLTSPAVAQAQVTVRVGGDVTVTEGSPAVIPVIKSGRGKANFTFETVNGSAVAGQDYTATSGRLTPGGNTAVTVQTTNDTSIEGAEQFRVVLRSASNKTVVTDGEAIVTILNNDVATPTPVLKWCAGGIQVPETEECPTKYCPDTDEVVGSDEPCPPVATEPDPKPIPEPVPEPEPTPEPEPIPEPTPQPLPVVGDILAPTLKGLPPILGGFDPSLALITLLTPTGTAAPDTLGAVRLTGGFAGVGRFDPKVYPGQPGAGHGHQFYGNTSVAPDSTYESLRTNGKSTLNYGPYTAQRSAYWQPWLECEGQYVCQPDYITVYYKRRPISGPLADPLVTDPTHPKYMGQGVELPHGLFYIFGYDFITGKPPTGAVRFVTIEPDSSGNPGRGAQTVFTTMGEAAASGKLYPNSQLWARASGPSCWDGKRVDTANHRDHVAYPGYGSWGYLKCPPTHPYVIPNYDLISTWTVRPGQDPTTWRFSSDHMRPDLPAGSTYHADVWFLWEPSVIEMAERGCLDQLLSCSGGRLNHTRALKNADVPQYPDDNGVLVKSWSNPRWRIPIPGSEANDKMVGFPY